jgi:hypothetical protein
MLKHVLLALNAMHVYALYMHVDMLGYLQTHTYNNCLLIAMPIKEMKLKDQRVSGFPYYNRLWSSQALIGENVILSPCTSRMTILISHMHDWSLDQMPCKCAFKSIHVEETWNQISIYWLGSRYFDMMCS